MKICGCKNCERLGERNLLEEFELYCSTRELETEAIFKDIFRHSYTVGEMEKLYAELEPQFSGESRVVARIKSYSMSDKTWSAYQYFQDKYGNFGKRIYYEEES